MNLNSACSAFKQKKRVGEQQQKWLQLGLQINLGKPKVLNLLFTMASFTVFNISSSRLGAKEVTLLSFSDHAAVVHKSTKTSTKLCALDSDDLEADDEEEQEADKYYNKNDYGRFMLVLLAEALYLPIDSILVAYSSVFK